MKTIPRDRLIVRDSMELPFRGSLLWCVELDALSTHSDIVQEKLVKDLAHARRPSTPSLVAVHLNGTLVTGELAELLCRELRAAGDGVRKVALIGLDRRVRLQLDRMLSGGDRPFAHCFFQDYEKAKEWLAG